MTKTMFDLASPLKPYYDATRLFSHFAKSRLTKLAKSKCGCIKCGYIQQQILRLLSHPQPPPPPSQTINFGYILGIYSYIYSLQFLGLLQIQIAEAVLEAPTFALGESKERSDATFDYLQTLSSHHTAYSTRVQQVLGLLILTFHNFQAQIINLRNHSTLPRFTPSHRPQTYQSLRNNLKGKKLQNTPINTTTSPKSSPDNAYICVLLPKCLDKIPLFAIIDLWQRKLAVQIG